MEQISTVCHEYEQCDDDKNTTDTLQRLSNVNTNNKPSSLLLSSLDAA